MNKKILIPTILFAVVLVFSFFALSQEKDKNQSPTNESAKRKKSADKPDYSFLRRRLPPLRLGGKICRRKQH